MGDQDASIGTKDDDLLLRSFCSYKLANYGIKDMVNYIILVNSWASYVKLKKSSTWTMI